MSIQAKQKYSIIHSTLSLNINASVVLGCHIYIQNSWFSF
uniref:Uncharacterized protein n=1 Tax=Anguilla anguilla TaxID=7936 RepID=A0A0E9WWM8_ANGAN